MSSRPTPSVRNRRIGMELRRLRDERRMTIDRAARTIWRSTGWLSGVENGYGICGDDLEDVLDRYGVEDPSYRAALVELARVERKRGWWRRHARVLSPAAMDFISLESDSRSVCTYEVLSVPGLLQTPAYARALITDGPGDPERAVAIRMARQQILRGGDAPRLSVVLTEAVVRQLVGGAETMSGQLDHLMCQAGRDMIDLRVIPFEVGAHVGFDGSFTLMEIGRQGRLAVGVIESPGRMTYVEADDEVRHLGERFQQLQAVALNEGDTCSFIERIRSKL
ncbi:DUF5753 domain-containing protein [Spirillospora sp. NPDC127200]